ncbi:MAG: flagellar assembly protein FliW [Candidatus Accumulibacter sp.]|jgi:flagellar assembly factor FliW|nr:flagellar assembly protein FliW [Accumulibacter sp.]
MKIDIDRFGLKDVQVDPNTLFTFPKGMAGFENYRNFKLFHQEGGGKVFWLQSVDDAKISFPIMAPDELDIAYEIELSDEDCALIGLADPNDAAIGVVVYRDAANEANGPIAANTRSPVIFNLKTRLGMQKVLREVRPGLTVRAR